ncbi:hypothetical protein [Magnetospirillum fulvum]|uniref:Uncharacterized protein n=1 Tax=Magnetospirillum fulvum MGU-K5 TaxID=1316936 RepID=S9S9K7_MAGFU|nr:hypothetical protein [Magnetospirillum fulvum]EPY01384.1 hypothetical protein K678_11321 [Magnetospirillum fulvum MGU-K5]
MPSRTEHLIDIEARLKGQIPQVGDRIYRSRVKRLTPDKLPAICLYAPEKDGGAALVTGGTAQYQPTHTLAIEVRVTEADGFDVEAEAISEAVIDLLFRDQDWMARFERYPHFSARQFLDHRGEETFAGEVVTIRLRDRRPTEYRPRAPRLGGITLQIDVDGDGNPEFSADLTPKQD